jgi:type II secretion system protein I
MPTSRTTADKPRRAEGGFTLVETLVALLLLGLVGLALVRFQTVQIAASGRLALGAGAQLEADNRAVDFQVAGDVPRGPVSGVSSNLGRTWFWTATPGPSPDPAHLPEAVAIAITVGLGPGSAPLAQRTVVRVPR